MNRALYLVLLFIAACTAQAGGTFYDPATSGSGGGVTVTSDTYANCVALTPTAEGDQCFPTDSLYTLLSRDGATWVYRFGGDDLTPFPSSGWSWDNQGTATITTTGGVVRLDAPASGALDSHSYVRTAPATPWTITARVAVSMGGSSRVCGMVLRESGTGELYRFGLGPAVNGVQIYHNTSPTAGTANVYIGGGSTADYGQWHDLRITDDGASLYFRTVSPGGGVQTWASESRTSRMAAGPDQVGIVCDGATMPAVLDVISWEAT